MIKQQKVFTGGCNLLASDTALQDNEYRWLINARQRLGYLEANKKAIELDTAPIGKKQGIVAVGDVTILFVAGNAFYKTETGLDWIQISGFSMDAVADIYYTAIVPASTFNFHRKIDESLNNPMLITTDFKVSGTPAGILVQDGAHQPYIIEYDQATQTFIARVTKTYAQWANTSGVANDREYVPIGKQMMYISPILYIVSIDGKSVYRSVSGRPLDFMVNVDFNGNKLPSEAQGGASSTGFTFDSDIITNLTPINIPNSFIYGTARYTRIITADLENTIFGEPRFYQSAIIEAGIVNHQSVIEVLGDYAFVDFEAIKMFNAVLQLQNEGRNSIFSLQLSRLMNGIKQSDPVCVSFDNYCLFDIDTTWGRMCCVYDSLSAKWVSFDVISRVGAIKQFAIVETTLESKLYCITHRDEVFQLYASATEREVAILKTAAMTNEETKTQLKSQLLHLFFQAGPKIANGKVFCTEYVDDQQGANGYLEKSIDLLYAGINYPVRCPVIPSNKRIVNTMTFAFPSGLQGKKISYVVKWSNDARLIEMEFIANDIIRDSSTQQSHKSALLTHS